MKKNKGWGFCRFKAGGGSKSRMAGFDPLIFSQISRNKKYPNNNKKNPTQAVKSSPKRTLVREHGELVQKSNQEGKEILLL